MALAIDGPAQQQTLDSVLRAYFRQYVQNGPHRLPRLEEIQGQGPVGEADYLRFIARYAYEQEYHQSTVKSPSKKQIRAQTTDHIWQLLGHLSAQPLSVQQEARTIEIDGVTAIAHIMQVMEEPACWAAVIRNVQFANGKPPKHFWGCLAYKKHSETPIEGSSHRHVLRLKYVGSPNASSNASIRIHAAMRVWKCTPIADQSAAAAATATAAGSSSAAAATASSAAAITTGIAAELNNGTLTKSGSTLALKKGNFWVDSRCWLLCGEGTLPVANQPSAAPVAVDGALPAPDNAAAAEPPIQPNSAHHTAGHVPVLQQPGLQRTGTPAELQMTSCHDNPQLQPPFLNEFMNDPTLHQTDDQVPADPNSPVIALPQPSQDPDGQPRESRGQHNRTNTSDAAVPFPGQPYQMQSGQRVGTTDTGCISPASRPSSQPPRQTRHGHPPAQTGPVARPAQGPARPFIDERPNATAPNNSQPSSQPINVRPSDREPVQIAGGANISGRRNQPAPAGTAASTPVSSGSVLDKRQLPASGSNGLASTLELVVTVLAALCLLQFVIIVVLLMVILRLASV